MGERIPLRAAPLRERGHGSGPDGRLHSAEHPGGLA